MLASRAPTGASNVRVLVKFGRGLVLRGYERAYHSRLPSDGSELARWELPVAVARLEEGIAEDREALDRHIAVLMKR